MEVREPRDEDEVRAAWGVLSRAFGWPLADVDKFVEGLGPMERCRVAVTDDGQVTAFSRLRPFGQFFGGRRVAMGGHSPVGVDPEHRGRGLGTTVTAAHYPAMRARGEHLAALFPASTRLYRGAGFEIAGVNVERRLPIRSLQMLPPSTLRPRRASRDDIPAIKDCYRRYAAAQPGWLDRPDVWWDRLIEKPWDDRHTYVVDGDNGSVEAYVLYAHTPPSASRPFGYGIRVLDIVAPSRETALALWRLVASSSTMVHDVSVNGHPEDALLLLLPEQDLTSGSEMRWMLRLVDAAGAVAARGFRRVDVEVDLEIEDRHCEWNQGRWRLTVSKGEGRLERGGDGDVRLGVGALASLYAGYAPAGVLARSGLLRADGAADLDALDAAFSGPTPWMPDFF